MTNKKSVVLCVGTVDRAQNTFKWKIELCLSGETKVDDIIPSDYHIDAVGDIKVTVMAWELCFECVTYEW